MGFQKFWSKGHFLKLRARGSPVHEKFWNCCTGLDTQQRETRQAKCHSDWHATTSHHSEPRRTQTPCLRAPNPQVLFLVGAFPGETLRPWPGATGPWASWRPRWESGRDSFPVFPGSREPRAPPKRKLGKQSGRPKVLVQNDKNGASRNVWPFALSHGLSRQRKPPKGVWLGNTRVFSARNLFSLHLTELHHPQVAWLRLFPCPFFRQAREKHVQVVMICNIVQPSNIQAKQTEHNKALEHATPQPHPVREGRGLVPERPQHARHGARRGARQGAARHAHLGTRSVNLGNWRWRLDPFFSPWILFCFF